MFERRLFELALIALAGLAGLAACGPGTAALPTATAVPPTTTSAPIPGASLEPSATPLPAATPTVAPTTPPPTDTPNATPRPQPVFDPLPAEPLAVTVSEGLFYAAGALRGEPQEWQLDMYAPEGGGEWPVVVFFHGSGGSRDQLRALGTETAARGAYFFSADWPDMPLLNAFINDAAGYQTLTEVMACAVRFAREEVESATGEPAYMVLGGFSAGAAYGAHPALAGDGLDDQWQAVRPAAGDDYRRVTCAAPGSSAQVDAFAGVAGSYGHLLPQPGEEDYEWLLEHNEALLQQMVSVVGLSPGLRVRLLHGERDAVVPFAASERFLDALAAAGYDVRLDESEGFGSHAVPNEQTALLLVTVGREQTPEP